jgi:hypothetical protein
MRRGETLGFCLTAADAYLYRSPAIVVLVKAGTNLVPALRARNPQQNPAL